MQATGDESGVKLQSSYLEYLPALYRRELRVDLDKKKVWVAGQEVSLREEEFNLLAFLYERQGRVCSEEEIIANVELESEETGIGSNGAIPQIIQCIRDAIEHDPSRPHYLKTMDGVGYRLDSDEFMGRFLLIFENMLKPIENMISNLALYFDPLTAPKSLLPWLASWVAFALDPTWPEQKRRALVKRAAELYRWRGTERGLAEYLRIYTDSIPEISEYTPGMRLDSDTRLGVNTQLGSSGGGYHFTVTLEFDERSQVSEQKVRSIIDAQKPAHTVYTLRIVRRNKLEVEDSNGT